MEGGRAGLQIRLLFVICREEAPCCVFKKMLESILEVGTGRGQSPIRAKGPATTRTTTFHDAVALQGATPPHPGAGREMQRQILPGIGVLSPDFPS